MSSVCGYLEDTDSEGPLITEGLVPTPTFSGQVEFNRPSAISFAPATAQLASSTAQGTLMADFSAEPSILRDWRDMFPKKDFVKLVITWPGYKEWTASMADIVEDRDYITRTELAKFVTKEFITFASVMGPSPCSSPEWKLGNAHAHSIRNTSLAFLWGPAPGVWQPAFRFRGIPHNIKRESPPS